MANFFDQFDSGQSDSGGAYIAPSGRLRVVITPPPENPKYADAISSVESGGNYRAIGPDTGGGNRALGKYQVMASNVGPWSKEILGQEITPQEFLANPQIQDKIFNAKFGAYAQKYGPEGAARAWFAGEGGMNDPNRKDILGTTVAEYGRRFTNALGPSQANAAEAQPQQNYFDNFDQPAKTGNFFDQFDNQQSDLKELSDLSSNALKPQVSTGRALVEGALSGASGNFRDEIYGASAASGLPEAFGGFRAPVGAARLAYESYTGTPGPATSAYNEAVNRIRPIQKAAEEQHPYATLAGNLGGALAIPVGGAMNAATLPGRIGQGAALGAGMGAIYGAGAGENLDERARGAVGGALLGGAIGGAAPVVVEGVTRGARAIGSGIANTVRGVVNPADEAARRVAGAMQRDMRLDPAAANRLTPAEFGASVQSGGPATLLDIGGETTRALARSAANTSPEGRQVLNDTINRRFETQGSRITDWIKSSFNAPVSRVSEPQPRRIARVIRALTGNADATTELVRLEEAARRANAPAYRAAYEAGDRAIWSPELERLTSAPSIRQSMQAAVNKWKDWQVIDGFGGANPGATVSNNRLSFNPRNFGVPTFPNLQFWDYTARNIADKASAAQRAGRTQLAAQLGGLERILKRELDSIVPEYRSARAGAAQFFGQENALAAGRAFVNSNADLGAARQALGRMSDPERELFSRGFASELSSRVERSGESANILGAPEFSSTAAREKFALALGQARAREFDRAVSSDRLFNYFGGATSASEAGANIVGSNIPGREISIAMGRMSPVEKAQFQDGFANNLVSRINRVSDRRNVVNQIFSSSAAKEQLAAVMGPQKYAELEAGLRVEGIMDFARSAIQGNSTTARQLAELGLAGGAYGLGTGGDILNPNPSAIMNAALVYGLVRGRARVNENVARKVAEMLTSNDPTVLLRGIKVLSKSQQLFNSLRAFDGALAKIGGSRAAPVAGPLLPAIGRAEQDQQTIPGPPAQ